MAASSIYRWSCLFRYLSILLIPHASANCFWPNGTDRNSNGLPSNLYEACDTTASVSMCCALDSTSDFLNNDSGTKCYKDGLCINQKGNKITRTACTDETWDSPYCTKLCAGTDQDGRDVFITECDNGSYCCGDTPKAKACCQNGQGLFIKDGRETKVNPNATASTTIGPQTVTQVVSSAPQATSPQATSASPTPKPESSVSTGAMAGGVVGGVLGLAAIVGAGWFLMRRRRRMTASPPPKYYEQPKMNPDSEFMAEAPADTERKELSGFPAASDLGSSKNFRYELDSRS